MILIDLYSEEIEKSILFQNYPNNTISYLYRKKNEKQQIVEEYYQTNLDEFEDISISYRKYDTLGRLISDVQKNIFTKNTIAREYKYESQGDILITIGIEDGVVSRKTKEYKDKNMVIQVTEYYTLNAIDSLYMKPNQNYSVTYEENFKFLVIEDLDKFGNPLNIKLNNGKKIKIKNADTVCRTLPKNLL